MPDNDEKKARLEAIRAARPKLEFLEYDWALNAKK